MFCELFKLKLSCLGYLRIAWSRAGDSLMERGRRPGIEKIEKIEKHKKKFREVKCQEDQFDCLSQVKSSQVKLLFMS